MAYGMSEEDKQNTLDKILKSKDYILTHGVEIKGEFIPFAKFTKNAWFNADKYIAEINNRASSLVAFAAVNGLVNVFITLTLPSEYHPRKTLKNGKVISNPKFINDLAHTPKAGSKVLSSMWKRILDLRPLKDLQRDHRCYFRITEPHKNGTPHLHVSLFVPKKCVERVFNSIFAIYQFPQIEISSQYIPDAYMTKHYDKTVKRSVYKKSHKDNFGVTTLIKNPLRYMMKYILKTLDDLREDDEKFTDLTLWYIFHGIGRFYTSRTLMPLKIYRKINYLPQFQNLLDASMEWFNGRIRISGTGKTIDHLSLDENGEIIEKTLWYKRVTDPNFARMRIEEKPTLRSQLRASIPDNAIPVEIDGREFILKAGVLTQKPKPVVSPALLKDKQLYDYYYSLHPEDENISLLHYGITQNEMVRRGLLDMPLHNLNDFNLEMEEIPL